jgi:lysophospholipase L1-like esterase
MYRTRLFGAASVLLVSLALAVVVAESGSAHSARADVRPAVTGVPYLRVMPLGDSITYGVGSTTGAGYRYPLWTLEHGQSQYTVDLVGSQRAGAVPDPDNEGHSGYFIDQIGSGVDAWLSAYRPDVVLLHIGINDLDRGPDKPGAVDRLTTLVNQIFVDRPTATVILGGLIAATPGLTDLVATYNAGARQMVDAELAAGHHVLYTDMPVTAAQLADGLHPNDSGYVVMAQQWHAALQQAYTNGWLTGSTPVTGSAPETTSKVRWADFDGDGREDYLVIADSGAVTVWLDKGGDGHGGWSSYGQVTTGLTTDRSQVRFADFDGDGRADYLRILPGGAVVVYLNRGGDGNGGWVNDGQVATGLSADPEQVRFADFDGDGKADYLRYTASGAVTVYLNGGGDGHGGWVNDGQIATGTTAVPEQVRWADFDGDGKADYLALDSTGAVHAYLNRGGDGHGGWADDGQVATGLSSVSDQIRFADIDGDGKADYLRINLDGSVDAYLNQGGDGHGGWVNDGQIATGTVVE